MFQKSKGKKLSRRPMISLKLWLNTWIWGMLAFVIYFYSQNVEELQKRTSNQSEHVRCSLSSSRCCSRTAILSFMSAIVVTKNYSFYRSFIRRIFGNCKSILKRAIRANILESKHYRYLSNYLHLESESLIFQHLYCIWLFSVKFRKKVKALAD